MPVFHTKTIESILEPVAQQVSRLVILHEEAEDGNAMPDLNQPVRVVKAAVDNLVKVGYDTINISDDQILKQDMPPALKRVEESSLFLMEASQLLASDPFSVPARKKLIEGSRGILQGTSSLLLAFDESEVRKIIRGCKSVLDYLGITEVVDMMEDLVTFVKNLSPVLTKMTKDVDNRSKELTHQVHSQMLVRSLEQVKALTPVLISGIKILITASQSGQGLNEARNNRDYTVRKMSDEIHEIIRVLQLTTYDEDEWDADDLTVMKKAQNAIEGKIKPANDWLHDPAALVGSLGDKALRQIIDDSRKIAERCTNQADTDGIMRCASDVESMVNALSELRQQGKGSSPHAMSLAKGIQDKLLDLKDRTAQGIMNTERSGIRKPAPTVDGKVEQARQWLANTAMDDKGLGEAATRMVVNEGRKVANCCSSPQREELLRLCDEAEILTNQLADLTHKGMGNTPQAKAIARNLSEKLAHLKTKIQDALVTQVAEDFIDPLSPLKRLSEAATIPQGTPHREAIFEDRVHDFETHATRLSDTANSVATAGGCRNKQTVEAILKKSNQIKDLTPQVVNAARILFSNPGNQAAVEHFDLLKKQWEENMERLRMLTDEAVDSAALIRAEEEGILRDTERIENAIVQRDADGVYNGAANIAHRAGRVLQVAEMETGNSEDPNFVDRVNQASDVLSATITPEVQSARLLASNPADAANANQWRKNNQALIDAVGSVRTAVRVDANDGYYDERFPPPPDMSQLHISAPPLFADLEPRVHSPVQRTQECSSIFHPPPPNAILILPNQSPYMLGVDSTEGRSIVARVPPDTFGADMMQQQHQQQQHHLQQQQQIPVNEASLRPDQMYQQHQRAPPQAYEQHAPPLPPPPPPAAFAPAPAPPVPPPPVDPYGYYNYGEGSAPPRPPLPHETVPPRPPPPETDDEDDSAFFPLPQPNQPIMMAAHALHMETKQWSSKDNEIIAAAKKMALLMAKLSQLVRGEVGSKRDLIATAKAIAEASEEVTRLAKKLAAECTDKKMRMNLLNVCERIPTIGTQLKILSTVKATMLGAQAHISAFGRKAKDLSPEDIDEVTPGSEEDQEATEMLVGNAQNLMQAVKETVRSAEAASIKIRVDSGYTIRWARKRPWYT